VNNPGTAGETLTENVTSTTVTNNCLTSSTDPRYSTTVAVSTGVLSIAVPGGADLGAAAPVPRPLASISAPSR
jgi:hypothetical protein